MVGLLGWPWWANTRDADCAVSVPVVGNVVRCAALGRDRLQSVIANLVQVPRMSNEAKAEGRESGRTVKGFMVESLGIAGRCSEVP